MDVQGACPKEDENSNGTKIGPITHKSVQGTRAGSRRGWANKTWLFIRMRLI